ncbi:MAG TPA: ribosome maturation factor RimM [Thiobacillaceae bacterium]|nr:ribosome maturation factor RimM [Thiobacillaceae bacterium]
MGRIGAPFGIKGWIKVQPYTETLDSLFDYDTWQVGGNETWQDFEVEEAAVHGDGLIAKLVGVEGREQAFALRGKEIAVSREELPQTEANEYYWNDLIGLTVVNPQGVEFGQVAGLMETGSHDVLVVNGERQRLIPFADAYVTNVDLRGKRIEVNWEPDW